MTYRHFGFYLSSHYFINSIFDFNFSCHTQEKKEQKKNKFREQRKRKKRKKTVDGSSVDSNTHADEDDNNRVNK